MAELLPALSSDDDNGKFDDNDDEDDEDEQMDVVFGGLLVSCVCQKASNEFYEQSLSSVYAIGFAIYLYFFFSTLI